MMYLLDTHTLIWFLEASPRLPKNIKEIIINSNGNISISIATMWEFTIKHSKGKLSFEGGLNNFWRLTLANRIDILTIKENHLNTLLTLPFHHNDPFDRLIIASAIAEGAAILTTDENIQQYNVPHVW